MNRVAAIRHYRERALNSAALLAALEAARVDDRSPLRGLIARQDALIEELLNEFAFAARKFFELAEQAGIPIRAAAMERSIPGDLAPNAPDSSLVDLWWVIGRLIHSVRVTIRRGKTHVPGSDPPIFAEHAWAFDLQSDLDRGMPHFIYIEFLLSRFVSIDEKFDAMLNGLGER
jgi:hypothetical protein